ncbi:MAG: cytochrome c family protein [Rhizobiaceae bacterium]|nr:cytochrome c family protein [Rhizobiaceae bacterium]
MSGDGGTAFPHGGWILNTRFALVTAAFATAATFAHAGDAVKGALVFKKCQACHTATEPTNRVGPSLQNIVGRPVATADGFRYSKAMMAFGAGKTWDEALLAAYLPAPRSLVKGTTMAFAGLKNPEDVDNIIAYLRDPAAAK